MKEMVSLVKKMLLMVLTLGLILGSATVAGAGYGQSYLEYKNYDSGTSYNSPRIGGYWGSDKWLFYLWHNISGYNEDYCSVGYGFTKKLHLEVGYDNNDDTTSDSIKLSITQPLTAALSLYGEACYVVYDSKVWQDYNDLKFTGGLRWQVNPKLTLSSYLYSTQTKVDYSATNYDSTTFGRSVGFWYQVYPLSIWGNYIWTDINYQDQSVDASQGEKYGAYSLGVTYSLNKKFSIYCSYYSDVDRTIANKSALNTETTVLGISYNFY
jgi:predicted porin